VAGIMSFAEVVWIMNSEIEGNVANGDYGGIYVDSADSVVVRNSSIAYNTAYGRLGDVFEDLDLLGSGGLAITSSTNVQVEFCNLQGNWAYQFGGGLYVSYSEHVSVSDTTVLNNTAVRGGGISLWRSRHVSLSRVHLEGNWAEQSGAGMYANEVEVLAVTNCSLLHNRANSGSGSAVWLGKSTANITGSTFDQNTATLG
jgi:hypothetical protein